MLPYLKTLKRKKKFVFKKVLLSVFIFSSVLGRGGGVDFLHYLRTYLQGGGGEKRTGAYKGGGSKLAIFLRTYFMDDPLSSYRTSKRSLLGLW